MNRCGADRLDARSNDGQSFAEHVAAMDQRFQEVDLHWSQVAATQQLSNSFLWLLTLQGQIGSVVVFEYCSWFPSE